MSYYLYLTNCSSQHLDYVNQRYFTSTIVPAVWLTNSGA